MKIPEKVAITVTADGAPLEGVPAILTFFMTRKNNYGSIFGPSDSSGLIEACADEVRREGREEMEFFLMDYADIDTYWSGRLQVTPVNREGVARALKAYRLFRCFKFPPGYEQMLLRADAILSRISHATLAVEVRCEGGDPIEVEAVAVSAG